MSKQSNIIIVLTTVTLLFACNNEQTPTVTRDALTRPVIQLHQKKNSQIVIPNSAIVVRSGIPGVFILSKENEARFRMVKRGKRLGTRMEIISGLSGNETLVVGDLSAIHDGSPIQKITGKNPG